MTKSEDELTSIRLSQSSEMETRKIQMSESKARKKRLPPRIRLDLICYSILVLGTAGWGIATLTGRINVIDDTELLSEIDGIEFNDQGLGPAVELTDSMERSINSADQLAAPEFLDQNADRTAEIAVSKGAQSVKASQVRLTGTIEAEADLDDLIPLPARVSDGLKEPTEFR